jgi:hypothetical protein
MWRFRRKLSWQYCKLKISRSIIRIKADSKG